MSNVRNQTMLDVSIILGLLLALEFFDSASLNLIFPSIANTFNVSGAYMKVALTSYLMAESVLIPVSGYLSHKVDLKIIIQLAAIITALASIGAGLSHVLLWLVVCRTTQGAAAAFITPICRLLILKIFPKEQQLGAINLVMSIALVGLVAGPVFGALLAHWNSWRLLFYFIALLATLCLILVNKSNLSHCDLQQEKFPMLSYIPLVVGIISFYIFFDIIIKDIAYICYALVSLAISILTFTFYLRCDISDYFIPKRLLAHKQFLTGIKCNFLFRMLFGSVLFTCSLVLQTFYDIPIIQASGYLIVYGLAMIFSKRFIGKIIYNYGYKKSLIINSFLLFILVMMIAFDIFHGYMEMLYLLIAVYGVLASIQYSSMNILNLRDIEQEFQTKANTLLNIVRLLGTNFGISICALFISLFRENIAVVGALILASLSFIGCYGVLLFKNLDIS